MIKSLILLICLTAFVIHCQSIDISIDADIGSDEEYQDNAKYTNHQDNESNDFSEYEDVKLNLVKAPQLYPNKVVNEDIHGFLHKLRMVIRKKPLKNKPVKPIFRQPITIIANSAEKDYKLGTRKKAKKSVPKVYMPLPQAISHILGKEHIPNGVYENLGNSYNYRAK